jgi:cyclase
MKTSGTFGNCGETGGFMEKVTNNVYAATDIRGCNPGYVVTSEGVIIIDTPQLPTKAVAMREEALKKGPIRFLINTEQHIDHIFGNYFFLPDYARSSGMSTY